MWISLWVGLIYPVGRCLVVWISSCQFSLWKNWLLCCVAVIQLKPSCVIWLFELTTHISVLPVLNITKVKPLMIAASLCAWELWRIYISCCGFLLSTSNIILLVEFSIKMFNLGFPQDLLISVDSYICNLHQLWVNYIFCTSFYGDETFIVIFFLYFFSCSLNACISVWLGFRVGKFAFTYLYNGVFIILIPCGKIALMGKKTCPSK